MKNKRVYFPRRLTAEVASTIPPDAINPAVIPRIPPAIFSGLDGDPVFGNSLTTGVFGVKFGVFVGVSRGLCGVLTSEVAVGVDGTVGVNTARVGVAVGTSAVDVTVGTEIVGVSVGTTKLQPFSNIALPAEVQFSPF